MEVKLTLLETREPLKQSSADLSSAKDTLALFHDMTWIVNNKMIIIIIIIIIIIMIISKKK